jgi:2-polyprenyl-3-methyl-5-hydroxy-6-metoxy-1,4-benzoquinol methylase
VHTKDILRSSAVALQHIDAVGSSSEAPPFEEMGQIALDVFRAGPEGPVLQTPIGDGRMTNFLAGQVPFVVGMSDDFQAVNNAMSIIKRGGAANVALFAGSLDSIPDGMFAGVFCAEHLGHLRKPGDTLRELFRVTAPGGHVVVDFIAPQDATRHASGMVSATDGGYLCEDTGTFYRYLDPWKLEEILGEAGVRNQRVTTVEKSWEKDADIGSTDVLERRHSWVVVIRRDLS